MLSISGGVSVGKTIAEDFPPVLCMNQNHLVASFIQWSRFKYGFIELFNFEGHSRLWANAQFLFHAMSHKAEPDSNMIQHKEPGGIVWGENQGLKSRASVSLFSAKWRC